MVSLLSAASCYAERTDVEMITQIVYHVNSVVEEGAHGKYSVKSEECGGVDPQDNTQEPHEEKRNERGLYQVTSRARHLVYHEAAHNIGECEAVCNSPDSGMGEECFTTEHGERAKQEV